MFQENIDNYKHVAFGPDENLNGLHPSVFVVTPVFVPIDHARHTESEHDIAFPPSENVLSIHSIHPTTYVKSAVLVTILPAGYTHDMM